MNIKLNEIALNVIKLQQNPINKGKNSPSKRNREREREMGNLFHDIYISGNSSEFNFPIELSEFEIFIRVILISTAIQSFTTSFTILLTILFTILFTSYTYKRVNVKFTDKYLC